MQKSPHLHASFSSNMAVRGGLTRFARPKGQPARCASGLSNGQLPVVEPRSEVLIPPAGCYMRKKSPHLHASSSLNMAVRGGLTRFARPKGQPARCASGLSNGQLPVVEPRSEVLIPPRWVLHAKKKPAFVCELLFKYGGEGGLTRFARPKGQPARCASGLSNGQLPVVEPRSEVLIPPAGCYMRKKSPHLHASFSSNMAVRGGFEPPIRCRIHTFQACSFSHSDTSPYCLPSIAGTALM